MKVPLVIALSAMLCLLGGGRRLPEKQAEPVEPVAWAPRLVGLGKRLVIRAAADSWGDLCAQTTPAFTWNGRDMMWIESDADGKPVFRLNRAWIYGPGNRRPQWVILETRNGDWDDWPGVVRGDNLEGIASLRDGGPEQDHGSGDYAVALSVNEGLGTVYEVGWHNVAEDRNEWDYIGRRLYLLQDAAGKWTFLGEGPVQYDSRSRWGTYYYIHSEPKVTWDVENGLPCDVTFVINKIWQEHGGDDPTEFNTKEEGVLDAETRHVRITTPRPYVLAEKEEEIADIIERLSACTKGWDYGEGDNTPYIRRWWRESILALNPGIEKEKVRIGRKVWVMTNEERQCLEERLPSRRRPWGCFDRLRNWFKSP